MIYFDDMRNDGAPEFVPLGRRYAGRAGDGEFAVLTSISPAGSRPAYRLSPCPTCPWRKDSRVGAFPAEAYRLAASTAYDMAQTTFGCHESGSAKPQTCAGFLLREFHNLAVRLALCTGKIDLSRISDGGIDLFEDYREMSIANGVDPADPILAPCR